MRFFNTTGPCRPELHYMLPAQGRLPNLGELVARQQYFVVHAARQTGKTTATRAFAEDQRASGAAAVHATLERCQGFDAVEEAEPLWIDAILAAARIQLPEGLRPPPPPPAPVGGRLGALLAAWSEALDPVPVVLLHLLG